MAEPLILTITWQRLVDAGGNTCARCQATEAAVTEAARVLQRTLRLTPIRVVVEKKTLTGEQFQQNPLESNRLWVAGQPLEDWLPLKVGQSSCCGPCGDKECRTVLLAGQEYEAVPAALIVRAGLAAAAALLQRCGCKTGPEPGCC